MASIIQANRKAVELFIHTKILFQVFIKSFGDGHTDVHTQMHAWVCVCIHNQYVKNSNIIHPAKKTRTQTLYQSGYSPTKNYQNHKQLGNFRNNYLQPNNMC